jgi:hypothetical protein
MYTNEVHDETIFSNVKMSPEGDKAMFLDSKKLIYGLNVETNWCPIRRI